MTILRRAATLFRSLATLLGVGMFLAVAVAYQGHLAAVADAEAWKSHTYDMVAAGQSMVADIAEVRGFARDAILTGDPAERRESDRARSRFLEDMGRAGAGTVDNPRQAARIRRIGAAAGELFARVDAGDSDAVAEFARVRRLVAEFVAEEQSLLPPRLAAVSATLERANRVSRAAIVPVAILMADAALGAILASRRTPQRGDPP